MMQISACNAYIILCTTFLHCFQHEAKLICLDFKYLIVVSLTGLYLTCVRQNSSYRSFKGCKADTKEYQNSWLVLFYFIISQTRGAVHTSDMLHPELDWNSNHLVS